MMQSLGSCFSGAVNGSTKFFLPGASSDLQLHSCFNFFLFFILYLVFYSYRFAHSIFPCSNIAAPFSAMVSGALEAENEAKDVPVTEPIPTEPPQGAKPATCGVCNTNPPKYKCPRCYMPYCSVVCNKKHRENHPPDPDPVALPAPAVVPASQAPTDTQSSTEHDPDNPFRLLEQSDKLKVLFLKYPSLPEQLRRIHEATLPPKPSPGSKPGIPESLMQGVSKKETWNHDMGIKNGKAALRRAKSADGEEGEGVREYYELVLHMMNEASDRERASQFVQQQLAQEDTKLIERLLAQEKR
ncbi:hypothetical protein NLU13_6250 [Sarocladium strictum]|uniref:HIT-type domain-containing protein n=1 Tax=Sarocladium strictum TaxID=5046 RepID=A0AA39GGU4_SARSR|nr:hypothetical protein NLU13_6250 [Sarocladium strictum]